jgi:hypothetical protein
MKRTSEPGCFLHRFAIGGVFALFVCSLHAQTGSTVEVVNAPVVNRSYQVLREKEDWSFLRDKTLRSDLWDPIKYIPMHGEKAGWYTSVGGEAREVWEQIGNDNFGVSPFFNGYLLERYMLHADTRFGPHVRTFVQLKSGIESGRVGGPRPIDEKRLDLLAAFLEVGIGDRDRAASFVRLVIGRQELNYGSGRLVSVREGPNVRQSFDGFRLRSRVGAWNLDGWAVRPDLDKPGFFDNAPNHATEFWGIYASRLLTKSITTDCYYLGLDRQSATFNRGTGHEVRQNLGTRLSKPITPAKSGLDFDYEAVWQFGTFGSGGIQAWSVASDTGYSLPTAPLHPRFSMKADISSGDDPHSRNLGTFNPIFPLGNYFGVLASTGPGPVNFIDVHPRVQTVFPHNVAVSTDWVVQWRQSLHDGVYSVPGSLLRPAGDSRARFDGNRPGVEARWQIDRHAWIQADYGIFYSGQFLKDTQPGKNLNYWALWTGYKF